MLSYKAPEKGFEECKIKPSEYLVEDFGGHCVIHRVLSSEEFDSFSDDETMVTMDGTFIIPKIATCKTIKEAEIAIHSYWNAVKQLNSL